VLGGVVLLFILVLALLPVVVSSQRFTRMIQAKISDSTGGTAAIGDLSVGWLKGVQVSDFRFEDKTGWTAVNIKYIAAQPQLTRMLGGDMALGRTVIDEPRVELDLRKRPAPKPRADTKPGPSVAEVGALALTSDLVVNNGNLRITDAAGKTVEFARLNTELSVRPPGRPSRLQLGMVVADGDQPGRVQVAGEVTPQVDEDGWSLKGTSGEFTVEVNDLDLESVGSILALAGVEVRGKGKVTGSLKSSMVDGQLQDVNAVLDGADIEIAGDALQGDRLQTSTLDIDAQLKRQGQAYRIDTLQAKTDWASVTATGALPTTPGSLKAMLERTSAHELQAQYDVNLAAILSQMPKTLGLKAGTQIASGSAAGRVTTSTEAGRVTVAAEIKVVDLAGTVEGKEIKLSEPLEATARLSADEETAQLDELKVSAAFATVTASGDFEQIDYAGTVDLAKLEAELGQFVDLGRYELAGKVSSSGRASIIEDKTSLTGSASIEQLVLSSDDGQQATEPTANVDFELSVDPNMQLLTIANLGVRGSFGRIDVNDGVVPLDETSSAPLALEVSTDNLDLEKVRPFAVVLGVLKENLELSGLADARFSVTKEDAVYRARTEGARIDRFRLQVPPEAPFSQRQVTAFLDARFNPETDVVEGEVSIESPDIKMRFSGSQKLKGEQVELQGTLEGQGDPNAVGPLASVFTPAELELKGRSTVDLDFSSTYPANDPDELLAHLNSTGQVTFDRAEYMGLRFGLIDVNLVVMDGLMEIPPFEAAVNEGQLQFAAQTNFRDEPRLLRAPASAFAARNIQLNTETTEKLLKYVNPLFANLVSVSGRANFECEKLVIPLTGGHDDKLEVIGTISADELRLGAGGLLGDLMAAMGESLRQQRLTIRPTRIVVRNGMVRYDNMQVDVGDNPLNFAGAIGLDGRLDMTVTLPWTLRGRTARVGDQDRAGSRIALPLRGTVDKPELDTEKLLQDQLIKGLQELFR
jgi:hypothetical protein